MATGCLLNQQEDDMDGIHIVAFAEEEDPGCHFPTMESNNLETVYCYHQD